MNMPKHHVDIEPESSDITNEITNDFQQREAIVTVYKRTGGEIVDVELELEHQTALAILEKDYPEWDPKKHPRAAIIFVDPNPEDQDTTQDLFEHFSAQVPGESITFEREEEGSVGPYQCFVFLVTE